MSDEIYCDVCLKEILDYEWDLYHATTFIDGYVNKHTHLCHDCFHKQIRNIPMINKKGKYNE